MRSHHMSEVTRLVTAEELEKFPDDDYRYELVQGRVIRRSPVGYEHGKVVMRLGFLLQRHLHGASQGVVLTEVGFTLTTNPDTVRAPDIAFIRGERIPARDPKGFWKGPPDLAVEVLSPDDRTSEMDAKVLEYLRFGVPLVVVIDPDDRTATAFRPSDPPRPIVGDDALDLSDIVRGFSCSLRDVFET